MKGLEEDKARQVTVPDLISKVLLCLVSRQLDGIITYLDPRPENGLNHSSIQNYN